MELQALMQELEAAGTAQACKIYRRHGVPDPMFGVSFAKLGELKKRLKVNQELALGLWSTGNADARQLAVMLADPKAFSRAEWQAWAEETLCPSLASAVGDLAAKGPMAMDLAKAWSEDPRELVMRAGWSMVAQFAIGEGPGPSLDDAYFEAQLARIEAGLHAAPNRGRQNMHNALIAIGSRNAALEAKAIAAARRLGPVHIDHGETGCKTPDAEAYILKARAHNEAKAAKATAKAAEKSSTKPAAKTAAKAGAKAPSKATT